MLITTGTYIVFTITPHARAPSTSSAAKERRMTALNRLSVTTAVWLLAAWLAAASAAVGPEGDDTVTASAEQQYYKWAYNGRTYRVPHPGSDPTALPALASTRPTGSGVMRVDSVPILAALTPAPEQRTTGLGIFGLAVVFAAVAGVIFVAVSFVQRVQRRREELDAADEPVLMTATGLVVKIEQDPSKMGTGLITLNKRERSSAVHRADVRNRTDSARRAESTRPVAFKPTSDPLQEIAAEFAAEEARDAAAAEAQAETESEPDAKPSDPDMFDLDGPKAAEHVDTVSERIRQKHQSGTRRIGREDE